MMKNKKILVMTLIMLFVCGCSAKQTIIIDKKNISENIVAKADNTEFFNIKEDDPMTEIVYEKFRPYKEELIYNDYKYNIFSNISSTGIKINKKYDDICNLFETSHVLKKLYKKINCSSMFGYYTIKSEGPLLTGGTEDDSYILDAYENYELTIKTNYLVKNNNADKNYGNKYTWNFNKSNINKSLNININKNLTNSGEKKLKIFGIILLILILIFGITTIILRKKYREEKI